MGNPFWLSILSENVGGAGTTDGMEIQMAGNPDWISLTHDWGGYFKITGQSFEGPLSVRLTQKLTGEQVRIPSCEFVGCGCRSVFSHPVPLGIWAWLWALRVP
jgi:hypothetical protein